MTNRPSTFIKACSLALVILALVCNSFNLQASPPSYGEWEKLDVFSDEFNKNTIRSKQWQRHHPYWGGRAPGLYTRDNSVVWNNELLLITKDDSRENQRLIRTGFFKSKKPVKYGYFEIKAKIMPSKAASGFFLYRYTKKATFEIDVIESGGRSPKHEKVHHSNTHVYYGDPTLETDDNRISDPKSWNYSEALTEKYHLYGLEWDDLEIRWYFDNQLIRRKKNVHWHLPMFIHLTTGLAPKWFGIPDKKDLPQAFRIAHIRSWKRTDLEQE